MQLALPFSLLTLLTIVACATESSPPLNSSGNTGNPPAQSGSPGTGGKTNASSGGAVSGGASTTAGSASGGAATGGLGNGGRSGAGAMNGGSGSTQGGTGSTPTSGGIGAAGASGGVASVSYALPPPSQCHNQDYIDYQEGCKEGDATSKCGGKCNTINACLESTSTKPHADTTFICPRFMLFSDAMRQAAMDDGNAAFNYAVVGHDVDRGGIDGTDNSTCCQCYQLVYAYPSPANDRQAQKNPDNPSPPESAIAIPPPLIVQSFNTAATPHTFDVYMAAGGLGANNACAPNLQPKAMSGQYLYSAYPDDGQPSQGGVKPASLFQECKTDRNWVTAASLEAPACQSRIEAACSEIKSDVPGLT
ncbi:MAG TPA: hypothetical protein VFQ61_08095, partial [Polyangiaceae bacterium]|nr:hypothetical protein [Polyangiaceae bacterium]